SVLPGRPYQIKVSKEGFFSESRKITIPPLSSSSLFSKATGYDTDFELTRIQKEKEVVINNIFYDFNKASLRPESKKELNKLVSMLKETPNVIIQINSHTDSRGSDSYNQRLSQRRAQRVVDYLTRNGVSPDRLFARGYGEKRLLVKNASAETEHQLNRRTAFKVLAVLAEKSSPTHEPAIAEESGSGTQQKVEQGSTEERAITNNLSYRVQVMVTSKRLDEDSFRKLVSGIPNVRLFREKSGEVFKYQIGERSTYQQAVELRRQVVALGQKDCFIKAYHRGEKVSVNEALKIEQP
ncbi:MAG TPA: OmpA family protein, partial [Bacteroidales bacterium]|nr:OmpA family protein [Bacteroidales bacterium]